MPGGGPPFWATFQSTNATDLCSLTDSQHSIHLRGPWQSIHHLRSLLLKPARPPNSSFFPTSWSTCTGNQLHKRLSLPTWCDNSTIIPLELECSPYIWTRKPWHRQQFASERLALDLFTIFQHFLTIYFVLLYDHFFRAGVLPIHMSQETWIHDTDANLKENIKFSISLLSSRKWRFYNKSFRAGVLPSIWNRKPQHRKQPEREHRVLDLFTIFQHLLYHLHYPSLHLLWHTWHNQYNRQWTTIYYTTWFSCFTFETSFTQHWECS